MTIKHVFESYSNLKNSEISRLSFEDIIFLGTLKHPYVYNELILGSFFLGGGGA